MFRFELDEEFNMRVKHNFRVYILLTSKSVNWREDDILDSIYRLSGYRCHKTVKYGRNSSHIHVKFEEEYLAKEAVEFLNKMNSDLTAILVDDMLRDWFNYEMKAGYGPPWTLTIVDIVGNPPLSLNFLTSNILNSIFSDFGAPYLMPYTAALNEPHVQVLFGSMTEALATCMAFGEWYERNSKIDSFFYRVRINPSDKEAYLIRNSGGTPKEAFKLDYFLNMRSEIMQNAKANESDAKQNKIVKTKTVSQNKGTQKVRKQKYTPLIAVESQQSNLLKQIRNRTPILCVPVIAPLNSYTEALMATNRQLGADFTTAILNFQQTCSVSARAIVAANDTEVEHCPAIQYRSSEANSECGDSKDLDQSSQTSEEKHPKDIILNAVPPSQTQHTSKKTKRNIHKGTTRIFERRR